MFRDCTYDENKDIQAVDSVGWIDIAEAIKNGYVPGSIEADEMTYNDIEDPASIMTRASDVFELYRQGDYVKGYKSTSSENDVQTEEDKSVERIFVPFLT